MHGSNSLRPASAAKPRAQRPRVGPRRDVNRRAVVLLPRTRRPHPVFLRNVSAAGACIQTDAQLALGEDITLRIELDAGKVLIVEAIVIGIRPRPPQFYSEFGLRFARLDSTTVQALASFVERQKAHAHA
jgi:hypothetical protein